MPTGLVILILGLEYTSVKMVWYVMA